ncbi:DUF397 domain-containing protein [Streptomyces sp. NPDC054904]
MSVYSNGIPADSLKGVNWVKSRHSGATGNCVELAALPDGQVAMRNSRDPLGPALIYTRDEITAFMQGTMEGEFSSLTA